MVHRLKRTTRLTNLQLCTVLIRCIDLWLAAVRHVHVANDATTEALMHRSHACMHCSLLTASLCTHTCTCISAALRRHKLDTYADDRPCILAVHTAGIYRRHKLQDAAYVRATRHTPCTHFTTYIHRRRYLSGTAAELALARARTKIDAEQIDALRCISHVLMHRGPE